MQGLVDVDMCGNNIDVEGALALAKGLTASVSGHACGCRDSKQHSVRPAGCKSAWVHFGSCWRCSFYSTENAWGIT